MIATRSFVRINRSNVSTKCHRYTKRLVLSNSPRSCRSAIKAAQSLIPGRQQFIFQIAEDCFRQRHVCPTAIVVNRRLIVALDDCQYSPGSFDRPGQPGPTCRAGFAQVAGIRKQGCTTLVRLYAWPDRPGGSPRRVEANERCTLADADPALRAAVAEALGKIAAPAAVDGLINALEDQRYSTRFAQHAVVALGHTIGPAASPATKQTTSSPWPIRNCERSRVMP